MAEFPTWSDMSYWPCPTNYTGFARKIDGEWIFACGACPDPKACAEADQCSRAKTPHLEQSGD